MKIKLIAIAKDESAYLSEWIHHHIYFGIDAIHIAINDTTDCSVKLLEKIKKNHPNVNYSIEDELKNNHPENFQSKAYRKLSEQAKKEGFSHVLLLDIDEFLVSRDFKTPIKKMIQNIGQADCYLFHWFKHCDESKFSKCFKEKIKGKHAPQIKSLISLNSDYKHFHVHNVYGDLCYKTSNGNEYTFKKEDKTRANINNSIDYEQLPYLVIHRLYRSQQEYLSLLLRGRPKGDIIKNNRFGYYEDKDTYSALTFPPDELEKYYSSLEEMIKKNNIESEISNGQSFVDKRYHDLLDKINNEELSEADIISLTVAIKNISHTYINPFEFDENKKKKLIQASLNLTSSDVDFLRDLAVKLEPIDIETSFKIMSIAQILRPHGKFIDNKIKEYNRLIKHKIQGL